MRALALSPASSSSALLVTCVVRPAIGVDVGQKHQLVAVGRKGFAVGFRGQASDLARMAAVGVHDPDLLRASAIGDEINLARIRRPARTLIHAAILRKLARPRASVDGHHVNLFRLDVLVEIRGLDRERHQPPVGAQRGIGDPRDLEQSLDSERLLLGHRGGGSQHGAEQRQSRGTPCKTGSQLLRAALRLAGVTKGERPTHTHRDYSRADRFNRGSNRKPAAGSSTRGHDAADHLAGFFRHHALAGAAVQPAESVGHGGAAARLAHARQALALPHGNVRAKAGIAQ